MIKFSAAILEWMGSYRWRLHEPMTAELAGETVTVPEGFVTNMASIPRIFWNILPPTGKYAKAAILHDWLYTDRKKPRAECDRILLDGMKSLDVEAWKRYLMYGAVRLFGKSHYK